MFGDDTSGVDRLGAALGLNDDEQLLALLDAPKPKVRGLALRTVLLLEWVTREFPHRLLAGLTVEDAQVRLAVAKVLEAWNEADALAMAIAERVNDQGDNPAWPVSVADLRRIAVILAQGDGLDKQDMVALVGLWDEPVPLPGGPGPAKSTSDAREAAEHVSHRLELIVRRSGGRLANFPEGGSPPPAEVAQLAFGTYVGLGSQVVDPAVRAAAVGRLARLSGVSEAARLDGLIPSLSDAQANVRLAAFKALQSAGLPQEQLVVEALATGRRDLGQQALTLLADAGNTDALWDVLAQRDDGLQIVAFELLLERAGEHPTARAALDARAEDVRARGVSKLSARYDDDPESRSALTAALQSRFPDVRRLTALTLAAHGDTAAFSALVDLLQDDERQGEAVLALRKLPDPRVGNALLDRFEDDPRGTAKHQDLLNGVGRTRDPAVVDRLVRMLKVHEAHEEAILSAVTTISGYDQHLVFDPEEPDADDSWLEEQHPRRDDVFARLLQLRADRRHRRALQRLFAGATWSRGPEVDQPLARMLHHADDAIRQGAALAYGWRLRYRQADAAPLHTALSHKDPPTAFLAAEGLARAGASAGISVLLAGIDTLDDISLRHRAVLALGHLGDERALDKLLDILEQDGHALIESAVQAIGHLRNTEKRDQILQRLLQLSRGEGSISRYALVGLRWFGSPDAWARVRQAAGDSDWRRRAMAADLLRHDQTSTRTESREVLERLILRDSVYRVRSHAAESLRRLEGPDSLEPDYVFVRAGWSDENDTIPRLRERGDPARILDALAYSIKETDTFAPLLLALASRDPLPLEAAMAHLADPRPQAGAHAARLIGRAGLLSSTHQATLRQAAERAIDDWEDRRERELSLEDSAERVRWLLWAAARHGVGGELLVRTLAIGGRHVERLHIAAAEALPLVSQATEQLAQVARTGDARARSLAAGTLAQRDPAQAAQLLRELLDDRSAAEPMLTAGVRPELLGQAASQLHVQGVALPHLVADGNLTALADALGSQVDEVRLGALQGLGALASEAGEAALRTFATDDSHEEEERKAAWRALRRSRRLRMPEEAR